MIHAFENYSAINIYYMLLIMRCCCCFCNVMCLIVIHTMTLHSFLCCVHPCSIEQLTLLSLGMVNWKSVLRRKMVEQPCTTLCLISLALEAWHWPCTTQMLYVFLDFLLLFVLLVKIEVEDARPRGRPEKTWRKIVEKDCQARKLNREDAMDRKR